jgi:hypothetical protein
MYNTHDTRYVQYGTVSSMRDRGYRQYIVSYNKHGRRDRRCVIIYGRREGRTDNIFHFMQAVLVTDP